MQPRLLLLTLFSCIFYYSVAQTTNGLVAHYPFNNSPNDVVNGNITTVVNATLSSDRFGNQANAYAFNGTPNCYLNLGSNPILKPENITISLWVSINSYVSQGSGYSYNPIILTKNGNRNNFFEAYCIYITNNSKFITITTQPNPLNEKYFVTNQSFFNNNWYHVAMSYNKDSLKFYINGQLDKKIYRGFTSVYSPTDSVMIGNSADTQNNKFLNGKIDDLRIYNRSLSDFEVLEIYRAESNPNTIFSVQSGNWNSSTSWSLGRIPNLTDNVLIKSSHNIVVPNTNFFRVKTISIDKGSNFLIQNGAVFLAQPY